MFTKTLFLASMFFAVLPSAGCNDELAPEQNTYPGTINSETLPDFDNAQICDAETACPDGLECMYVAALELETPICVDGATICDAINCGEGECLMLESYPGQIMCSSGDGGGGDDNCTIDSDGNTNCPDDCTVSSDGMTSCPEDSGDGGDSEPGNPGGS